MGMLDKSIERMTGFPKRLGKLYRSLWTGLQVMFLKMSVDFQLIADLTRMVMPIYRIAPARRTIVYLFYYPCKFAVFQIGTAYRFQGS